MESKLIHRKWFLYLTEFFAGMSVMAVELGASRLMAPYFSSSQIVWTVIIGVIMIAMAIGNVWGGKLADQAKSPDRLYRRLIIAAIWIALIPFVGRWLIGGVSLLLAAFVTKNFLVWAALAACLLIFAFPCVLLGTVTPSLTRFTVDNLDDTGKTVGRLNALNTIGSILAPSSPPSSPSRRWARRPPSCSSPGSSRPSASPTSWWSGRRPSPASSPSS